MGVWCMWKAGVHHRSAAPLAKRGWFESNAPCEQLYFATVVRQQLAQLVTTHTIVAGSIPAGAQDFDLCAFVCVAKTAQQLHRRPIGHPRPWPERWWSCAKPYSLRWSKRTWHECVKRGLARMCQEDSAS